MRDQQTGLGNNKQKGDFGLFKPDGNILTLEGGNLLNLLQQLRGLLYLTLSGNKVLVSTWRWEQSGGCEANFCSPPFPKMKQLQSDRESGAARGRRSFHE